MWLKKNVVVCVCTHIQYSHSAEFNRQAYYVNKSRNWFKIQYSSACFYFGRKSHWLLVCMSFFYCYWAMHTSNDTSTSMMSLALRRAPRSLPLVHTRTHPPIIIFYQYTIHSYLPVWSTYNKKQLYRMHFVSFHSSFFSLPCAPSTSAQWHFMACIPFCPSNCIDKCVQGVKCFSYSTLLWWDIGPEIYNFENSWNTPAATTTTNTKTAVIAHSQWMAGKQCCDKPKARNLYRISSVGSQYTHFS